MGTPTLHNLTLEVVEGQQVSDRLTKPFGIRTVSSAIDENGHRIYK